MISLLPPNATKLELSMETAIREAIATDHDIEILWDAEKCPSEFLPWLADALSVDYWDASWTDERKRRVIATAIFVHRHKGTAGAIKRALEALELAVRVIEWFEDGGDPYTFKLEIEPQGPLTTNDLLDIFTTVDRAKNARSHLEALIAIFRVDLTAYVATASRGFARIHLPAAEAAA